MSKIKSIPKPSIICLSALMLLHSAPSLAKGKIAEYVPAGNVSVTWNIKNFKEEVPDNPQITNLTFPITVYPDTRHGEGTYFAQQYQFYDESSDNVQSGYTGLQPRENSNGKEQMLVLFSNFITGATTDDSQCLLGADGGDGVSCKVMMDYVYGREYSITIEKSGEKTWIASIKDAVTGQITHIGSYTLPSNIGNLKNNYSGFVEYYGYIDEQGTFHSFVVPGCDQLYKTDVLFGPVTTTNYGGGISEITEPHEYNSDVCLTNSEINTSDYSASEEYMTVNGMVSYGQRIIRGFVEK